MKRFIGKPVTAAEDTGNSKLEDMIDGLKDDFAYVIAGLEKLGRTGATEANEALMVAESLNNALQSAAAAIADNISE